jgi:hypothetical protein
LDLIPVGIRVGDIRVGGSGGSGSGFIGGSYILHELLQDAPAAQLLLAKSVGESGIPSVTTMICSLAYSANALEVGKVLLECYG